MVVEFSDKLEQNKALINSKRLKSSETFKEIYINKDLTTAEAELERVLRIERNNRTDSWYASNKNSTGLHRINPSLQLLSLQKWLQTHQNTLIFGLP